MIDKANVKNIYRLSPVQGGMLFHTLYEGEKGLYFEQGTYRLDGPLQLQAFEAAWNVVVNRHDALRTAFVVKGVPEPLQVVLKERPLEFVYQDLSRMEESAARETITAFRAEDKNRGFDLGKDRLLRIRLFRLSEETHIMVMSFHHIVMDGWCQGILAHEFVTAYQDLAAGTQPRLPAAPQYRDFVRWLERQDKDQALNFWKEQLEGFTAPAYFPRRHRADGAPETGEQQNRFFALGTDETSALSRLAAASGVTLGTVIQTLWGILLGKLNGTDDAVFLSIVSGRPVELPNAENIVGLFINAIPVRVRSGEREQVTDICTDLHRRLGESNPFQFAPLAEIQAASPLKRDLANSLLVFENYPFASAKDEGPFTITQEDIDERTNYDITLQIHPGEELGFGVAFNSDSIAPETIDIIEQWFRGTAAHLAAHEGTTVRELDAVVPEQRTDKGATPVQIALTATFTAEPILPALRWWLNETGYRPEVAVAEYNQVFQQLLDPESLLARCEGYGLLAVRFEDWIRDFSDEAEGTVIEHLHATYSDYVRALQGFAGSCVLIHMMLPTDFAGYPKNVADTIRELYQKIGKDCSANGVALLDARNLDEQYALDVVFDPVADSAGHVPYSQEAGAAIGTAAARKIFSRSQHSFKVIAVDCDNTLWDGIVGEDGPGGCHVFGGYRVLQEFLVERYKEGYLIVLNSKNNENDVWEVFDNNPDMILRREHVVAWRINWKPKSGNLKEMAEELNLGLNSFLFIDDSGMECAEVRENAPEVLTIRVPKNHQAIPRLLQHIWALDKWQVTDEDRKRSEMYKAERGRQEEQSSATSLEDFLKSLELRISMAPVASYQIPRFSQLTQRTNQFNISTIRRDENQIRELAESPDHVCWVVTVEDRFGEYGIVGALICRRDENTLVIDTLLLSCRVLGRGVEEAILTGMRKYAEHYGLQRIEALFIPTKKNAPALRFMETWPGEREEAEDGSICFRRSVESLPNGVPFGDYEYRTEPFPAPAASATDPETKRSSPQPAKHPGTGENNGAPVHQAAHHQTEIRILDIPEEELQNFGELQHRFYYLPLLHSTGTALAALPDPETGTTEEHPATGTRPAYVAPSTEDERTLAGLFGEVLRVEHAGMHDNFFDLGGHSLSAVELLSKIHRAFGADVSLRAIFDNPTPCTLLRIIRTGRTKSYQEIEALPKLYHYDLSHAQRRLWVLDNIQSDGASYVMGGANRLKGRLDIDALERAVHSMIHRHESLRTGIILVHGEPRQRVFDETEFSVEHVDLSNAGLSPEQQIRQASEIIRERETMRFDLSEPPLLRVTLVKLAEDDYLLALFMHHIIGDGWSYPIFVHELVTLYRGFVEGVKDPASSLPPLRIHYKDYAAWQKQWLKSNEAEENEQYWLESLAGPLPLLALPTDFPHEADQHYEGAAHRIKLSKADLDAVQAVCRSEGATLFMFLLTAVRAQLWNYTRQRDIIVGTPVAGRDHPDLADQIGFFVNTLPLRSTVNPEESFAEVLRAAREEILEAFSHASYPFDLIVGKLDGLERNTGRSPVFDVMVALQNNRDAEDTIEGLEFRPFGEEAGAGKFDLVFNFSETQDGLDCIVEYRFALFREETITRIADNLLRTILKAGTASETSLQDIVLPASEVQTNARAIAATSAPDTTLVEAFRNAATQHSAGTALIHGGKRMTYGELNAEAESVAHALVNRGIRKGQIIAGILNRGEELVIAMLATMKAGALWLPIDPSWPESRIAMILEDSGATLAITDGDAISTGNCSGITLKELPEQSTGESELPSVAPDDSAYVIYTSGSTGKPKGVRAGHRGFLNMIRHQITTFDVSEQDTVLQFASPAFDASLSEMFMALLSGASLALPDTEALKDTDAFLQLMEMAGITIATIPPVYLRALNLQPLPGLRSLITAGEEAPVREVLFYASQGINVFNAYGPTECSVCATIHRVDPGRDYGERIPIGDSIPGTGYFVADEKLYPVPHGSEGELVVFGNGLAQDYLGRKDLTDERFLAPSWLPGTRCYRTGDRVKLNAEGELVFLGRIDEQVKIRGHRVEPEEVRRVLLEHSGVRDAAVIPAGLSGNKQLIGFVCGDPELETGSLLGYLAAQLPSFLVPQRLHIIDALPVTSNGKVDRKKLETMENSLSDANSTGDGRAIGPRTTEEAVLAKAFSEVLSREVRNIHENFFTLGGDSIKAIQMRAALRRHGYEVRSRDIYEGQTIEGIARHLQELGQNGAEELYVEGTEFTTPVVSWFSERLPGSEAERFILPLVVDSRERVDLPTLEKVLNDLQSRHPALRLTARRTDGTIVLRTLPTADDRTTSAAENPGIEVADLTDNPELFRNPGPLVSEMAQLFAFDGQSPLFRTTVFRGPEHDTIALVLHHLIVDAISQQILLNDLNLAYAARSQGEEPVFGIRSASFGAWAGSLGEYASSISAEDQRAWEAVATEVRETPGPFGTASASGNSPARSGQIAVDGEDARHILHARRRGVEVYHVLLSALAETFAELTGQERIAVLMESHGRGGDQQVDLTESVGWFTAVYPVILPAAGSAPVTESIKHIRTTLNNIQGREAEYGALRYSGANAALAKSLDASPQISFNYLGEHSTAFAPDRTQFFSFTGSAVQYTSFNLNPFEINAIVTDGVIRLNWSAGPNVPDTVISRFEETFTQHTGRITDALKAHHAEIRMICMPVAGSTTRTFDAMANAMPDTFETIALELPGHGARLDQEPLEQVPDIVDDLLAQMAEYRDKPYILFGHSLGALLNFEVIRRIVATGEEHPLPLMMICSGAPAPFHLKYGEMMSELPDYEFIRAYHLESVRRGETPPTGTMLEKMIVATRADYVAVENYHYAEAAPLPVPFLVLRGSDEYIVMEMVMDWEKEAGAGMTLREVHGGHEYPFSNAGETADTIVQELLKTGEHARQLIP